jgi:type III secretion protein J
MRRFALRAFVLGCALLASACTTKLQHELNEDDANEIYVLLIKNGIDATKEREGEGKEARYIISVPKADAQVAAELMRDHSLPRPRSDGLAIFKQTKGMIPTQTEERAMFIEAVGGEVSNALNRVPGVLEARTIVMIPENNDLTQPDKRPLPSASVLIKYFGESPPLKEDDVQEFVAHAVPEMKKENVKVIQRPATFATMTNTDPYKSVMGISVRETSATTLKLMIGGFGLFSIVMAAAVFFLLTRKPATSSGRPSRSRTEG